MEIVNSTAQQYAENFSSQEEKLMSEIAAHTYANHPHSDMLSGHVQGKFLEMISRLMQPERILEIGTFVGYSSLYLSKGLKPGGKLHTLELRDEDADTAEENFRKANATDKIILHRGNALEIIPTLHETWDIVFIDADKVGYSEYYKLVLPNVRSGGLIIADNVLFHGEVLEENIKGKNPKAIHAFNEMIKEDGSVEKVMLTVRDGLFLIRKK
ncbi:MAG: O-methyltransferase [Bacteroidetes bacterium]|nr:O-methyltransferase [Bacteroidota bacterium]